MYNFLKEKIEINLNWNFIGNIGFLNKIFGNKQLNEIGLNIYEDIEKQIVKTEKIIERKTFFDSKVKEELLSALSQIKQFFTVQENCYKLQTLIRQMAADEKNLSKEGRINSVIIFLLLQKINGVNYSLEIKNNRNSILSEKNDVINNNYIYNISEQGLEYTYREAVFLIYKHLDKQKYSHEKNDKILIFGSRLNNCSEECMQNENLFELILLDCFSGKEEHTFMKPVNNLPTLNCAYCISQIREYEKAQEIYEVIFDD
jgi:hypothetical protein